MSEHFKPRCRASIDVVLDGRGAPNSAPFHIEVDCRSASVSLNGFYEADTFSVDFDAKVLPFDPDQIASCHARVYMWDEMKLVGPEWLIDANFMVGGISDDIDSNLVGEDTTIKITGRDYTGLLIEAEWDSKNKIPGGRLLDQTVQDIADAAAPEGSRARFEVVWKGEGDPPIVGGILRSTKKKGLWIKPGKSYWDVIWDLCVQHAYVPHVEGQKIIISEPVTQTKQSLLSVPKLVYGENLDSLSIKRKFGREKVPQIVVRAWDPDTKKTIEVVYPKKRNTQITGKDALGTPLTSKKDEQMFFPAPAGVYDRQALERYAKARFYHLGRGETVYSMKTSVLSVEDFNLLQLRPGYAIGVRFEPFNESVLRSLEDPGQRVARIVAQGYSTQVAQFVAANLEQLDLFKQNYYYNRGDISYDINDGIEIGIEAANFAYEVREVFFAERAQ